MDKERIVSRASDAAMIVAAGKLMVFRTFWKEISALAEKEGFKDKKLAQLRAQVKNAVDDLDDNIFFVSPGHRKTPEEIDAELKRRIKDAKVDEQIMKNLRKDMKDSKPDLRAFLT